MLIKEFLRKLNFEVSKRENLQHFTVEEFYFPTEQEEVENLVVGETQISITGELRPE